jgi:hypothetical protein
MSNASEIVSRFGSVCLLVFALGGCSDDAPPKDGGSDAKVTRDSRTDGPPAAGDGPVQPQVDGAAQPWADKGVLQCAEGIPANCCELMRQHEKALAEAKQCTAGSKTCTKPVVGDLPCKCKTFVNADSAAVTKMSDLEQQWSAAGCPAGTGCSTCQDPKSSNCEALGGAQKCVDIL